MVISTERNRRFSENQKQLMKETCK